MFGLAIGDIDLVPSLPGHAYLLALGVLSQSIGYLAIQASLPRLPAVIASVLLFVQPMTTLLLGAILLAELPSPAQLAGVALVLFGIALATGGLPGGSRAAVGGGAGRPPDAAGPELRGRAAPARRASSTVAAATCACWSSRLIVAGGSFGWPV